jgi:hypothetical protein
MVLPFIIASAFILGSESRGTRDHILRSQIRDYPNLEGQVPVFISPRNRVTRLYPQTLGSLFVASYDTQGAAVEVVEPASTRGTPSVLVVIHMYSLGVAPTEKTVS